MTIGVLPIVGRLLTDSLIFHCYCSSSSYVTIMGSQGQRHTRNQQTSSGNDIIRFNKSQLHKKVQSHKYW